jgi:hypothetical protein
MVAATPVLLAGQFATLPLYLWLFAGGSLTEVVEAGPFVEAFVAVIALPLGAAALTERLASRSRRAARRPARSARCFSCCEVAVWPAADALETPARTSSAPAMIHEAAPPSIDAGSLQAADP